MSKVDMEAEQEKCVEDYLDELSDTVIIPPADVSLASIFEDLNPTLVECVRADWARILMTDDDFAALCRHPIAKEALGTLVERYMELVYFPHGWFATPVGEFADGARDNTTGKEASMSQSVTHTFTHDGDDWEDALSRPASKERFTIKMLDGSTVIIDNPESVVYEYPKSMFSAEEWDDLGLGDQPSARFTTVDPDDPRVRAVVEASVTAFVGGTVTAFVGGTEEGVGGSVDGEEIVSVSRHISKPIRARN